MRIGVWVGSWAALWAIAALGFAGILAEATAQEAAPAVAAEEPAPKGNSNRGAIVYRSSCGVCHKDPKVFAKRFSGKDPRVRGVPFEDYVATHHAPSAGPKRDLIAYLKTL